jgi:hypothetical protein
MFSFPPAFAIASPSVERGAAMVKVGGNPPVEPEPSSPAKSENVATAEVFRSTLAQGSPMNPMTVTRVPEHLLPMSPVRTAGEGWGEGGGARSIALFAGETRPGHPSPRPSPAV